MKATWWLVTASVLLAGANAVAQPFRMGEQRPYERIEHWKRVRLIEVLDLKEEQSVRFFARLNEHENKKRELARQRDEVLDKIERLVRNRADEKEIEKLFPDAIESTQRLAEENRIFFKGLNDILSVEQRAKLMLFERRFEKELREAMRDVQRRRRGPEENR